ncbi:dephospho-CoA kinase [uncultured Muribaculum sp.]|uniref:dephospho-CoA kinase n=1 Tax=uncultured Muribaculum sp. TaxID=1918613 RepID=UPI00262976AD|nr:dephospho-CoA kinase [uncultured Muribaculum sp.]
MGKTTRLIAITGGIGSGKSVVSKVLLSMGKHVYDCDSRAKSIVDSSAEIKMRIACEVSAEAVGPDGVVDRAKLAEVVFADRNALNRLNAIVHAAVIDDIENWRVGLPDNTDTAWVESAIIYESGIDRIVDCVWLVEAPEDLRIKRVMARNGVSANDVKKRIDAQNRTCDYVRHSCTQTILNDSLTPLLLQIQRLLQK